MHQLILRGTRITPLFWRTRANTAYSEFLRMANEFIYTRLPFTRSVRLLRLYPGAGNDAIVISMELIKDYAESPPYYALSYC